MTQPPFLAAPVNHYLPHLQQLKILAACLPMLDFELSTVTLWLISLLVLCCYSSPTTLEWTLEYRINGDQQTLKAMSGSRKHPYPPHGRPLEIPRGGGGVHPEGGS